MKKCFLLGLLPVVALLAGCGTTTQPLHEITTTNTGNQNTGVVNTSTGVVENFGLLHNVSAPKFISTTFVNNVFQLDDNKTLISEGTNNDDIHVKVNTGCAHLVVYASNGEAKTAYCLASLYGKFIPAEANATIPYFSFTESASGVTIQQDLSSILPYFALLQQNNATGVNDYLETSAQKGIFIGSTSHLDIEKNIIAAIPYRNGMITISYFSYAKTKESGIDEQLYLDYMFYDGRQYEITYATGESHMLADKHVVSNFAPKGIPLSQPLQASCSDNMYSNMNCRKAIAEATNLESTLSTEITTFKKEIDSIIQ